MTTRTATRVATAFCLPASSSRSQFHSSIRFVNHHRRYVRRQWPSRAHLCHDGRTVRPPGACASVAVCIAETARTCSRNRYRGPERHEKGGGQKQGTCGSFEYPPLPFRAPCSSRSAHSGTPLPVTPAQTNLRLPLTTVLRSRCARCVCALPSSSVCCCVVLLFPSCSVHLSDFEFFPNPRRSIAPLAFVFSAPPFGCVDCASSGGFVRRAGAQLLHSSNEFINCITVV